MVKRKGRFGSWLSKYHLLFWLLIVAVSSVIFALRNPAAFTIPNFYAEDATIFYQNVFSYNPFQVLLTPFNGYLVVGQYMVAYIAATINLFFGNDINDLAVVTAAISCLFLGTVVSLPYLLFRRRLGTGLALLIVLLSVVVPMQSFDYAIIGTIGNLKFAFLYIAFLLIIYRVHTKQISLRRLLLIDASIMICVLTNVTVVLLLPLLLWPYLPTLWRLVTSWRLPTLNYRLVAVIVMLALSATYVVLALIKGIPAMPGYLDGPFKPAAILPIADRSTFYALTYPFTAALNGKAVVTLGIVTVVGLLWLIRRRPDLRFAVLASGWAIAAGTGLFVANRPGVGDFFLTFGHKGGPDQFFYAQNLVFIFALGWLLKDRIACFSRTAWTFTVLGLAIYFLIAVPVGTSFGRSSVVYENMRTIDYNVKKACRQYSKQDIVPVQIYPTPYWQWQVKRSLACDY